MVELDIATDAALAIVGRTGSGKSPARYVLKQFLGRGADHDA